MKDLFSGILDNPPPNTVWLPFPPPELMPNRKSHWAKKSGYAEKAKFDAWLVSKHLKGRTGRYGLGCIFLMPDNVHRDTDNLVAAMKNAFDGMSEAMGVNDAQFRSQFALKLYRREYPRYIQSGVLVFVMDNQDDVMKFLAVYFDLIEL